MKIQKIMFKVISLLTSPRRIFLLRKCNELKIIGILIHCNWYRIFSAIQNIRKARLKIIILSASFLSGCAIQYPVWLGDEGVARMCMQNGIYAYTHNGITKQFSVQLTDQLDIYKVCGNAHAGRHTQACIINNYTIYVTPGRACAESMAHELSHGFGMHFVDRPLTHSGDSHG